MTLSSRLGISSLSKHCHTTDVNFLALGCDLGEEAEGIVVGWVGSERSKSSLSLLRPLGKILN